MRVLMTGHDGYIGTVMAPFLRRGGHTVVGLDSCLFRACGHGEPLVPADERTLDLRDVTVDDLRGFDAVVHLAALSNDPLGDLAPEHTFDINHHASSRLAELAKEAGVRRFLYSSSCSVYGAADTSVLVDETAPLAPVSAYAQSKVAVEADLSALADDRFSPVHLRNATAYGWSPRLRLDLVLNDLVATAYLTGEILVLSDGTPWRPLVHIEDISRAFLAALEAPTEDIHDEAFNVGTEADNHQVSDLADIVAGVVPDSTIRITGEAGGDPRSYRVSFDRIRRVLPSFQPVWDAERGARDLYARFREHGLSPEDRELTFRRLAWLRGLMADGRVDDRLRWVARA